MRRKIIFIDGCNNLRSMDRDIWEFAELDKMYVSLEDYFDNSNIPYEICDHILEILEREVK